MSAETQTPLHRAWHMAREYLTHWAIAGVIVTLTGFAPDHIVAHMIHAMNLDHLRAALPELDYRLLTVGLGVALIAADAMVLNRKKQAAPVAIAPEPETIDTLKDKPSIAVLPFVNMSKDPDQEYFADGMTEDIITGLSYDSRLFVIARNSTAAYKGQTPDVRAVGKELGVRYVLEGSIRPLNDMLRITAQLVETTTGTHVWADRIDRPIKEIFAISDSVVDGLVMALCSNLGAAEANRAGRQRPEDLQAWALCVQAENIYTAQVTSDTVLAAEKLVRRATEIDPANGPGWAILAHLISQVVNVGLSADVDKDLAEARSLANKALRLAPNDPLILGYCGAAYIFTGQTAHAIDCLERSLALNPNNGLVRLRYAMALWANGAPEAGLAQIQDFFLLSPRDPVAGIAHIYSSSCYHSLEEYPSAEEAARKAIKLLPGFLMGYVNLALSLAGQGRSAEAAQAIRKLHEIAPHFTSEGYASDLAPAA